MLPLLSNEEIAAGNTRPHSGRGDCAEARSCAEDSSNQARFPVFGGEEIGAGNTRPHGGRGDCAEARNCAEGSSNQARFPGFGGEEIGAGNETRTRDFHLGKVVLYQLSYSR